MKLKLPAFKFPALSLPSLPPNVGGVQAVALCSSAALMTATAGFRVIHEGFTLENIAMSCMIFTWDLGLSGLIHWTGHRLAISRAAEDAYDVEAGIIATAQGQLAELKREYSQIEAKLAAAEDERARRIEFDFQVPEMKAWVANLVTAAYIAAVSEQRGRHSS